MPAAGQQDVPGDDALMTLAAAGHQHAYVRLVERYELRIRGFCRMLTRDETLAYDLAQEVFLKIWKRREQYRPEGRFKEYLFTVARNECRSMQRKRAVLDFFGLSPNLEQLASAQAAALVEPADDDQERLQLLGAALTRLPEKFRVPLTLRFVEGLDYAEIARVIDRTESTARSRIFYGLKQLAALIPAEVMS
ncbi:MAG TPA: RNA polymerase sigma factor [Polyangiales bacterium]|nr:RNA polymerase sigma factor [Polyangiales bacterium]